MKKIFATLFAIVSISLLTIASAQLRKVPAEITEAFKAKFPETKNVEWKDKINGFQVIFETNEQKQLAKFNNKGEWQYTEKEITKENLPTSVQEGYKKSKFTDWELNTITWIENKDNEVQYRLLVKKSTLEKKYLYFDKEGKLIKDTITI